VDQGSTERRGPAQKPNVLFIATDQHRADTLGCYGNEIVKTPNLDRLAESGVRYENCIVQGPVCTPSRSCWLTGQYVRNHGVWANGVPLADGPALLPRLLRQLGYGTYMIGKLHVTPIASSVQPQDGDFGFDRIHLTEGNLPGGYNHWLRTQAPKDAIHRWRRGFPPERPGDVYEPEEGPPEELHQTKWVADRAIEAMERCVQHRPAFLHISFPDPHHPFEAPGRFASMYPPVDMPDPVPPPGNWGALPPHFQRYWSGKHPLLRGRQNLCEFERPLWQKIKAHYYAMVTFVDEQIGRILESAKQLEGPTVIIFSSDHGELLGDHGLLFKGLYHYDCLLKVPLIIAADTVETRGSVVKEIVQEIDIMPTILALCGGGVPFECQGRILPGIEGTAGGYEFALSEQAAPWYTPQLRVTTLRSDEWKMNAFNDTSFGELYNLREDPFENTNLWDDKGYTKLKAELAGELIKLLMETTMGGRRTFRA